MLKQLKEQLKGNAYALNAYVKLKNIHYNRKQDKLVDPLLEIDPILEYDRYKDYIIKWKSSVPAGANAYNFRKTNLESIMYGHGKALYHYAGGHGTVPYSKMPYIEHGIYLRGTYWPIDHHFSIISQGTFRGDILHKKLPTFPLFSVGPFVHYAEPLISAEEIAEYKKKLGKTLFIFPTHAYEHSVNTYSRQALVDDIMKNYTRGFDTVLVSAFWNDVADPVYDMFKAYGAKIVSCGFKFDTMFIRRLKTLMLLSDATLGNSLGTHIGYSLYLNRPHILISGHPVESFNSKDVQKIWAENPIGKNEKYEELVNFWDYLSYENYLDGAEYLDNPLYTEYWGGKDCVKSPEEMKAILEISSDLIKCAGGNLQKKLVVPDILLKKYEKDNSEVKYKMLLESIKI